MSYNNNQESVNVEDWLYESCSDSIHKCLCNKTEMISSSYLDDSVSNKEEIQKIFDHILNSSIYFEIPHFYAKAKKHENNNMTNFVKVKIRETKKVLPVFNQNELEKILYEKRKIPICKYFTRKM